MQRQFQVRLESKSKKSLYKIKKSSVYCSLPRSSFKVIVKAIRYLLSINIRHITVTSDLLQIVKINCLSIIMSMVRNE